MSLLDFLALFIPDTQKYPPCLLITRSLPRPLLPSLPSRSLFNVIILCSVHVFNLTSHLVKLKEVRSWYDICFCLLLLSFSSNSYFYSSSSLSFHLFWIPLIKYELFDWSLKFSPKFNVIFSTFIFLLIITFCSLIHLFPPLLPSLLVCSFDPLSPQNPYLLKYLKCTWN